MKIRKLNICLMIGMCIFANNTIAEGITSVYAITDKNGRVIKAYEVIEEQIVFQEKSVVVPDYGGNGWGTVGLAIDPESQYIFVTEENENEIALVNAKTMENIGSVTAPGAGNLAGVVYDVDANKLYAVDRETTKLFVYNWDAGNKSLTLEGGTYHTLENLGGGGAWGLALEASGLLFVTNNTSTVNYYDASDWSHEGSVDVGRVCKGIAIDSLDGYLYTGGYGSNSYLVKTDISDPNSKNERSFTPYQATGLAACPETNLLFVTTTSNHIEVFDPTIWPSDPCSVIDEGISGPAGIVVASGVGYKPSWKIYLDKDDGLDPCDPCSPSCYSPGDEFTYTITYGHNGYDHEWVEVTDLLPRETTFLSSTPQYNDYDPEKNSYFWALGSLTTNDPNNNTITIDVLVNEMAEPNSIIINTAIIETDIAYKVIKVRTPICCWEDPCSVSGVIYVNGMLDPNSTYNTGTSWENAYLDLQSALRRAGVCGAEIWVAMDTYSPGSDPGNSFVIPDTVEVYGGFIGDETSREQRDFVGHKTYLTGYISEELKNNKVVTMGDDTILDGFIVRNGNQYGTFGEDVDFLIANCVIRGNSEVGISCENGNVVIDRCVVKENGYDGLYSSGSGKTVEVNNCRIYENDENGIYCYNSTPTVINSMIHHNGSDGTDYYGIKLYQPSDNPDIRNDTIVYNQNEGIYFTGNNEPDINNCILWYNNEADDLTQLAGCGTTYYSCVTDPNDLPGSGTPDGNGNINCDPCFAYSDPDLGNFHLDPDSECIDRGDNSVVEPGEYDIDGDDRILDGDDDTVAVVDMGADEMACEDLIHPYDFNQDGIINLHEFSDLSRAWLLDDNDPNWADTYVKCDFHADGQIDILDLREFAEVWLWQACYRLNGVSMMMMCGGGGGMDKAMSAPAIAKMPTKAKVEQGRIAKWQRNFQPPLIEQIEVTEKLLNDGTKIEFLAYSTGDFLAKIVTDPKGNITHFILYLNDGNRVELICTYDSMGNETSAVYTHYDADGKIILVERMEDDMLLEQEEN